MAFVFVLEQSKSVTEQELDDPDKLQACKVCEVQSSGETFKPRFLQKTLAQFLLFCCSVFLILSYMWGHVHTVFTVKDHCPHTVHFSWWRSKQFFWHSSDVEKNLKTLLPIWKVSLCLLFLTKQTQTLFIAYKTLVTFNSWVRCKIWFISVQWYCLTFDHILNAWYSTEIWLTFSFSTFYFSLHCEGEVKVGVFL